MTSAAEPWVLENGTTNSIAGDIKHGDGDHDHGTTTTTELASPSVCGFLGVAVRPLASLRRLWTRYYLGAAVGQQEVAANCQEQTTFEAIKVDVPGLGSVLSSTE